MSIVSAMIFFSLKLMWEESKKSNDAQEAIRKISNNNEVRLVMMLCNKLNTVNISMKSISTIVTLILCARSSLVT